MQTGLLKTHRNVISVLTRILDVLLVFAGGAVAYWLRFVVSDFPNPVAHGVEPSAYGMLMLVGGLLAALVFPVVGVYRSWRAQGAFAPAARVLGAWLVVVALLLALLVMAKQAEAFSRLWLGGWVSLTGGALVGLRLVVFATLRTMRRRGYNRRSVVIVGGGPLALDLVRRVRQEIWAGFDLLGVFCEDGEELRAQGIEFSPLEAMFAYVEAHPVDEVWIALPLDKGGRLHEVLEGLRLSTANVRYAPDLLGMFLLNHGMSEVLGMPMIDVSASPMDGVNRLLKELEDRLLALLILVIVSPLMIVIAIGVKLSSPGPVFFRQERLGWNGRAFNMLKFRSMPVDVEKAGVQWGNARDKTATPFGAFLRRTSLDELPQFINVLKGDMSIVGPRPERPVFVEQFKKDIPGYMQKHLVKAGITGWAQVNGWRGDTDLRKRIEHDLYYIENWSLAFDLKIILLTVFKGFVNKNAY